MNKHQDAINALHQGRMPEALRLLEELLAAEETAELWNDWAAVQLASGESEKAEGGFSRALQLDPQNLDATTNLGLLLLSRGDRAQALPLLECALPLLPAAQQEALRSLLGSQADGENGTKDKAANRTLNILVIHDVFPHFKNSRSDLRLTQILRALRTNGHAVTFVARESRNRKHYEPALLGLGIETYDSDKERLSCLGAETDPDSAWSLRQILAEKKFDLAILSQNFSRGISISEQYLDDVRRNSPSTRIVVLLDDLQSNLLIRCAEASSQLINLEIAQDWAQRERESSDRADAVIVACESDATTLLNSGHKLEVVVAPLACEPFTSPKPWDSRRGIFYAGNFEHDGHREGFTWFLEQVWPKLIARSGEMELFVAGENIPPGFEKQWPWVKWLSGRDLAELMENARVFVLPQHLSVRCHSILTMLVNGLPGVTTAAAAEATGLSGESGIRTASSPDEFAAAVLEIYEDRQLWGELRQKGQTLVATQFSSKALANQLAKALARIANLVPKPLDPESCSVMRVERLFSERLSQRTGEQRTVGQLECYVRLAEQLLRDKKADKARQQLRHALSRLKGNVTRGQFLAQVFAMLKRCYRELGESEIAERCASAARTYGSAADESLRRPRWKANRTSHGPAISVIIPTYNRLPILRKCLAALEAQTVPQKEFEILVIDDGSSDGTEEAMRQYHPSFPLRYLRQKNSGTGAARCNGVSHARGEYLLLMNDDTLCDENVLEQHLQAQRNYASQRWAVLGNFEYPGAARQRALTHYFCVEPFMFPQVSMEDGCPYGYSHFITCNLSIRREAVLDAGSFDPTYKLSEDTELGIRLFERGYRVLYHPAAHAWHDHLPYPARNLIRRARVYGADYFHMFRNHPRVMKEWAMPIHLTGMDEENAARILDYVEQNRQSVEQAVIALERWDTVDFEPFLTGREETATLVLSLFRQAVPTIHWFYLFETMFQTMTRELKLTSLPLAQFAMPAAAGSGRD